MSLQQGAPRPDGRRRDAQRWLLGLALVTACSWGRYGATGSLRVDENYPSAPIGALLFVVLLTGYGLLVFGWWGLLVRPAERPRTLAFVGLGFAGLMLPMLSNDVFSLFAYGSLAARGRNVYAWATDGATGGGGLAASEFAGWVGQRWSHEVCVYGPADLVASMPAALAGGNPWLALLLLRVAWFLPLALVMEVSFRRLGARDFFHTMVWLNPLWLVEGPGQLHADLLGVVAVTAALTATVTAVLVPGKRGRLVAAWALFALAVLGKYLFAFTGVWFWLFGTETWKGRAARLAAMAAVFAVVAVALYAPFWRGASTVLEPIRALAAMNPGGTLTEVIGEIVHVLRGGAVPPADMPVEQAVALQRATHAGTWHAVSLVLRLVALVLGARVLRAMLARPERDVLAVGTGTLVLLVVTLASHRFQAWYLLTALPFFGLSCPPVWRRWWVAAVAASVSMDFVHVLPRSGPLLPAWAVVSTAALMVVFLMDFRRRYVTFDAGAR